MLHREGFGATCTVPGINTHGLSDSITCENHKRDGGNRWKLYKKAYCFAMWRPNATFSNGASYIMSEEAFSTSCNSKCVKSEVTDCNGSVDIK